MSDLVPDALLDQSLMPSSESTAPRPLDEQHHEPEQGQDHHHHHHQEEDDPNNAPIPSLEGLIRAAMDAPGAIEGMDGVDVDIGGQAQDGDLGGQAGMTLLEDPTSTTMATTLMDMPGSEQEVGHLGLPTEGSLVDTYMTTELEQQAQDHQLQQQQQQQQPDQHEHHHQGDQDHEHATQQLVDPSLGHPDESHQLGIDMNLGHDVLIQADDQTHAHVHVQDDGSIIPDDISNMDVQAIGAAYDQPAMDQPMMQDLGQGMDLENQGQIHHSGGGDQDVHDPHAHATEEEQHQQQGQVQQDEQDVPDQGLQQGLTQQDEQMMQDHQEQADRDQQGLLHLQMQVEVGAEPVDYHETAGEVHTEQGQAEDHTQTADQVMGSTAEQVYPGTEETGDLSEIAVAPIPEISGIDPNVVSIEGQAESSVPAMVSSTGDPAGGEQTNVTEIPGSSSSSVPVPNLTGRSVPGRRTISSSALGSGLKVPPNQGQTLGLSQGQGQELPEALVGKTREEIDDIKRRIVDRLESLLSATSLPHDKLLFSLSLRNTSGWIPLSTVAKYPKIRSYADTYGLAFVAESVRDANDSRENGQEDVVPVPPTASSSQDGGVGASANAASNEEEGKRGKKVGPAFLGRGRDAELVVDSKGERVRRKEVISKADTAWDRTVYAEGFGILDPSTTTTQDAIEEWFEQFAPITVVRFRRGRDPFGGKGRGDFRGSVFCEFRTVEGADLFLRTNPKPLFNGTEIVAMFKETYLESRIQHKALRHSNVIPIEQIEPESLQAIDKSLLKLGNKKRKREEEDESAGQKRSTILYILFNKHRVGVSRKTGTVMNKNELVYPERALLKFTGAGETGDWKILKEDLVNAEIEHSFLYLPRKSSFGYFAAPEAIGDEVVERLRNLHLIVGDSEIEWERVEGQEERDFYAKRASFQGKLAVKMADEKENLELDAVKETTKELRSAGKDRARGKSVTSGSGKKKTSGSASTHGNSARKGKSEDDGGAMLTEGMQMDE